MTTRRQLKFNHLDEAVADAKHLATAGYDRAANWSLEENLDHLVGAYRMTFEGVDFKLPFFMPPIIRFFMLGKVMRGDMLSFRAAAPPPLMPGDNLNLDQLLSDFEQLADRIERSDEPMMPRHPVFGKFTREQWQGMQRWHTAHHLSYLVPRG